MDIAHLVVWVTDVPIDEVLVMAVSAFGIRVNLIIKL